MIELLYLFTAGIAMGFGAFTITGLIVVSRLDRLVVGSKPVAPAPVPVVGRFNAPELQRLRYADEVLCWALHAAPLGCRIGPADKQ